MRVAVLLPDAVWFGVTCLPSLGPRTEPAGRGEGWDSRHWDVSFPAWFQQSRLPSPEARLRPRGGESKRKQILTHTQNRAFQWC